MEVCRKNRLWTFLTTLGEVTHHAAEEPLAVCRSIRSSAMKPSLMGSSDKPPAWVPLPNSSINRRDRFVQFRSLENTRIRLSMAPGEQNETHM